jgi:hypothetical protein
MNKNAAISVFRILNIVGGAARESKNEEPKKKRYYRHISTRYRNGNGSQPIYFQVRPLTKAKRCAWSKNSSRVEVDSEQQPRNFATDDFTPADIQEQLRISENGSKSGSVKPIITME